MKTIVELKGKKIDYRIELKEYKEFLVKSKDVIFNNL